MAKQLSSKHKQIHDEQIDEEMKKAAYEMAVFLYDLYIEQRRRKDVKR